MIDIKNMTIDELTAYMTELGESPFRAKQIFEWIYRGAENFDEMTNLSKPLREKLNERAFISKAEIERKLVSKDSTVKYLMRFADGEFAECVVMFYSYGVSMCISTQVGCNMGCRFCASTQGGKVRDLTAAEMVGQIMTAQKDIGQRISNIVLMGMGEPLDNYDEVIKFIKIVNHESGLNIGCRHITLSTCGLVPKMDALAKEGLPITLSVSLHAPNDEIRSRMMPVNRKYGVGDVIAAADRYFSATSRRVSFEYAMAAGVNDSIACARELAQLLRGKPVHVNLIPVNPIEQGEFQKSNGKTLEIFAEELKNREINVTIRKRTGGDIDASCGQLRKKHRETGGAE